METNNNNEQLLGLNNKTQLQLSVIASSYGISASKLNKDEIIEKIESIIKRKQELIAKKEINVNPFNKNIIELKIKEGIERGEWLFWKLFRNKIIFKNIFSFLYSNLSKSFDSIFDVNWLLVNDKIGILRDKVSRNQYLKFYSFDVDFNLINSFNSLFGKIQKNSDENIQFYQKLFSNYNQNLQYFNNQGNLSFNQEQELMYTLIGCKCLPAIQVLVENYNYKPTVLDLYKSIEIGSIKIINYFSQPNFNIHIDESLIFNLAICRNLKSLIHLYESGLLGDEITLDQFISKYIKQNISENHLFNIDNNIFLKSNVNTKLKSLIKICNLILESTIHKTNSNDLLEIKSFLSSISKHQLNSKLQDIINQEETSKLAIKKLFEIYYQVSGFEKHLFYLILFEKDNDDDNNYITYEMVKKEINIFNIILAFKCGNFSFFSHWLNNNNSAESRKSIIEGIFLSEFYNLNHSLLFTHCGKEYGYQEKLNFLDHFIKDIKSGTKLSFVNNSIFGPLLLFYLVISTDDMKLIEHVSNQIKEEIDWEFRNRKKSIPNIITRYIKSISALDYLYCNYFNHFLVTSKCSKWFYFNNAQLLKHFQEIHFSHSPPTFDHSINFDWVHSGCNDIFDYIISSGLSVFPIRQVNLFYYVDRYYTSNSKPFTRLQQFKKLSKMYSKSKPNIYFTSKLFSNCTSFDFIIFMDWLFRNYSYQMKIGGNYLSNEESLCFAYYKTNRYDLLEKQLGYNSFSVITSILEDCNCNDLNVVDLILNLFIPIGGEEIKSQKLIEQISRFIYCDVLLKCSKYGSLPTFEFIFQNYPIVLKKVSQSSINNGGIGGNGGGFFTLRQLKDLLVNSLKLELVDQSKFLFDLYQVTKSEFQNVSSPLSSIRFKDKVFK